MPQDDIRQLKAELASLRHQHQQLKIVAHRQLHKNGNGHHESAVIEKEPILTALSAQLAELKSANQDVQKAFSRYTEVQNSLAALLPALELQMEGWSNEIRNIKEETTASEQAYADLVNQLDQKIVTLNDMIEEDPYEEVKKLQAEVSTLQFRIQELEKEEMNSSEKSSVESSQPDDEDENPFTSLNIFGA